MPKAMPVPLAAPPAVPEGPESAEVSIRPCANGWISRKTGSAGGEFTSEERFHALRPEMGELMGARPAPPPPEPPSTLARTVAWMNGKRAK